MSIPLMRTSERGDFKDCQFYWYHHWVRGLSSRQAPTWSWFGSAIHKALEVRYPIGTRRGKLADVLDAFDEAVEDNIGKIYVAGDEVDDQEVVDAKALGIEMLKGYVKNYGLDSQWDVIHTEQPFQIDVHHPRSGRLIRVYCGTWDLAVWDRRDKVFQLVDHKTRRSFPKVWSFYDLNDQGGSYLWVGQEVLRHIGVFGKRDSLDGIVFNCLRKALPQPTAEDGIRYNLPRRKHYEEALMAVGATYPNRPKLPFLVSEANRLGLDVKGEPRAVQPAPLFHRHTTHRTDAQRVNQARKVIAEARQMDLITSGRLPLTKNPREDCVRCTLFDFCQLEEVDRTEAEEYAATMLVQRDPYADHREAMERGGIELSKK